MSPREAWWAIIGGLGIIAVVMTMVFVLNETMRGIL